jgi:hypothetical protein
MTAILRRFNLRPRRSHPAHNHEESPSRSEPSKNLQTGAETIGDSAAGRLPTEISEAEAVSSTACLGLATNVGG